MQIKPRFIPMGICDFYKFGHILMERDGTEATYGTWIARTSRIPGVKETVVAGLQMYLKDFVMDFFQKEFFDYPKDYIIAEYERFVRYTLFVEPDSSHIAALHDLGYLPLEFRALPEGTLCPIRVPEISIHSTVPGFAWVQTYFETVQSNEWWQVSTVSTIAHQYRKLLDERAMRTVGNTDFVPFQGHDFSYRGKDGWRSGAKNQLGHLLSFFGTDTAPAIMAAEMFYNANIEKEMVGTSVYATEHNIQCQFGGDDACYMRHIMKKIPTGIVSMVLDGYDFWKVISETLPELKEEIMQRDGKVVIRPDSGNPVDIICGKGVKSEVDGTCWTSSYTDEYGDVCCKGPQIEECEQKGLIECLWDIFGGTITEKGYKQLDPHIGAIYGDSITLDRAEEILTKLEKKGFASTNIVLGIGSYTYQYLTRDTFGYALKATLDIIDGKGCIKFKDPKTDDGTKKSLKGRVVVKNVDGVLTAFDGYDHLDPVEGDELVTVFRNGELLVDHSLSEIRERLASYK